jgi:hypothetical protein
VDVESVMGAVREEETLAVRLEERRVQFEEVCLACDRVRQQLTQASTNAVTIGGRPLCCTWPPVIEE